MRSNTHTQLQRLQAMSTASLEVVCQDGSMRYLSSTGTGDVQSGTYDTIIVELVGIRVVALYRDGDEMAGFAKYLPQEASKSLPHAVREVWGGDCKFVETPGWDGQSILAKLFEAASEGCHGCKDTACSLNGGTAHPSIMCGCDTCAQHVVQGAQEECLATGQME